MKNVKIATYALTLNETGLDLDDYIKSLMRECGVELNCPCGDNGCATGPTVNDELRSMIQVLATRLLAAEAQITALEAFH